MTGIILDIIVIGLLLRLLLARRQDTKYINFLERTRAEIDTEGPGFVIYGGNQESTELGGGLSRGSYKKLRPAIRAAMKTMEEINGTKQNSKAPPVES